jgi:hypothetical protein
MDAGAKVDCFSVNQLYGHLHLRGGGSFYSVDLGKAPGEGAAVTGEQSLWNVRCWAHKQETAIATDVKFRNKLSRFIWRLFLSNSAWFPLFLFQTLWKRKLVSLPNNLRCAFTSTRNMETESSSETFPRLPGNGIIHFLPHNLLSAFTSTLKMEAECSSETFPRLPGNGIIYFLPHDLLSAFTSTLNMGAASSFETSVFGYQTTQRHKPELIKQ